MMLSAFKERMQLLRINLVNSYRQDTAYFWSTWATLLSTLTYTLTYLLFVHVLFANVRTIAGYSQDEVLVFTLIGNLSFYLLFSWSSDNLDLLRNDVNRGDLDLVLTKPLPTLFYISTRHISLLQLLRDAVPPCLILILNIHWSDLAITASSALAGLTVFIAGCLAFHVIQFLLVLPVFWLGESGELAALSYSLSSYDLPYEGFPVTLRRVLTVFLPILISAGLSTSVLLGKSAALPAVAISVAIALVGLVIRQAAWNLALRNYTSASS
jgi:ABC-2 type transport system permease protein